MNASRFGTTHLVHWSSSVCEETRNAKTRASTTPVTIDASIGMQTASRSTKEIAGQPPEPQRRDFDDDDYRSQDDAEDDHDVGPAVIRVGVPGRSPRRPR